SEYVSLVTLSKRVEIRIDIGHISRAGRSIKNGNVGFEVEDDLIIIQHGGKLAQRKSDCIIGVSDDKSDAEQLVSSTQLEVVIQMHFQGAGDVVRDPVYRGESTFKYVLQGTEVKIRFLRKGIPTNIEK